MQASIRLTELIFAYESGFVLGPLSCSFPSTVTTVILGASGSGKSTLLRILAGLLRPFQGTLSGMIPSRTKGGPPSAAMVFQDHVLYPHLSVRDNLLLRFQVDKAHGTARDLVATELMSEFGIESIARRKPGEISGGERQRAAIIKAIASGAPVWLMDEPLSNLDAHVRTHARRSIANQQRRLGATLIYVTHDLADALTLGDHLIVMDHGKILQSGLIQDVIQNPLTVSVARSVSDPPQNEVPGRIEWADGIPQVVLADGQRVPIDSALSSTSAPPGRRVVALIDPEDVLIGEGRHVDAGFAVTEAHVTLVQYGSRRSLVECSSPLGLLRCYVSVGATPSHGDPLSLLLPHRAFRLFEYDDERRLK